MNLQEIDKWLDEEFGVSYTRLEELHDFVLEQGMKKEENLKKQLEAYENMRKEIISFIENNTYEYKNDKGLKDKALAINVTRFTNLLLNILNKVGEDNDTN